MKAIPVDRITLNAHTIPNTRITLNIPILPNIPIIPSIRTPPNVRTVLEGDEITTERQDMKVKTLTRIVAAIAYYLNNEYVILFSLVASSPA